MDIVFTKPRNSLVRLFAGYLDKMIKMKNRAPSPFGTCYEFGTEWGGTLVAFMLAAQRVASEHHVDAGDLRIFAFDSFEGWPSSDHPADQHGAGDKSAMANSIEVDRGATCQPDLRHVKVAGTHRIMELFLQSYLDDAI